MPPIFFSAPSSPVVCRVNCTAEASASHSRCRDTAALIRFAKNTPMKPSTIIAAAIAKIGSGTLAVAPAAAELQEPQPERADQQDSGEQADQPDVQSHVAVEDVAELVPDHALQLIAIELSQRSPGDRDRRVGRRESRRERVDAGLLRHDEQARRRNAGGQRHLLDDVDQPPQPRVRGGRVDGYGPDRRGDGGPALPQRERLA